MVAAVALRNDNAVAGPAILSSRAEQVAYQDTYAETG